MVYRHVSKLIQNKRSDPNTASISEQCICIRNNITITPIYHIRNSMSYQVVRCNYCGEEWAEYWICYRHMLSSHIDQSQNQESVRP